MRYAADWLRALALSTDSAGEPDIAVDEVNFHTYARIDGRRLRDEIGGFVPWYQDDGTPPAWQSA